MMGYRCDSESCDVWAPVGSPTAPSFITLTLGADLQPELRTRHFCSRVCLAAWAGAQQLEGIA